MSANTILDDTRSILENLLVLRTQVQAVLDQANKYKEETKVALAEYQKAVEQLIAREEIVKRKEIKIAAVEELDVRQNALDQLTAQLENDRKACDKECSEKRAVVAEEEARIKALNKDLEIREKALEEDKRTYKDTLLRKMGREIKCN
jgi:hypothetical protein